jgi:ribA/ribD-fused uncharacterized protein
MDILFYKPKDPYGELSNFFILKSPLALDNLTWHTSEAYYQAQKWYYTDNDLSFAYCQLISKADTAHKAYLLGQGQFLHGWRAKWLISKHVYSIVNPDELMTLNEAIAIYTNMDIEDHWKNGNYLNELREQGRMVLDMGNQFLNIKKDWHKIKVDVMTKIVYYKFTNDDLKNILLNTVGRNLIEHSKDDYWGDGLNDSGKNILGHILMHVRHLLTNNLPLTFFKWGSFVKLSNNLYYGIHPARIKPTFHIDYFVNLCEDKEVEDITYHVPVFKFPIKDRKAPSLDYLTLIVDFILKQQGIGYIHCKAGHGRSGTIMAALWGKLHGLNGHDALNFIDTQWRRQRNLKVLKSIVVKLGSPQTKEQKRIVELYLK